MSKATEQEVKILADEIGDSEGYTQPNQLKEKTNMTRYIVTSTLGEKGFIREVDATDYQIRILAQAGIKSKVTDTREVCENCGIKCGATMPYGKDCRTTK